MFTGYIKIYASICSHNLEIRFYVQAGWKEHALPISAITAGMISNTGILASLGKKKYIWSSVNRGGKNPYRRYLLGRIFQYRLTIISL